MKVIMIIISSSISIIGSGRRAPGHREIKSEIVIVLLVLSLLTQYYYSYIYIYIYYLCIHIYIYIYMGMGLWSPTGDSPFEK